MKAGHRLLKVCQVCPHRTSPNRKKCRLRLVEEQQSPVEAVSLFSFQCLLSHLGLGMLSALCSNPLDFRQRKGLRKSRAWEEDSEWHLSDWISKVPIDFQDLIMKSSRTSNVLCPLLERHRIFLQWRIQTQLQEPTPNVA